MFGRSRAAALAIFCGRSFNVIGDDGNIIINDQIIDQQSFNASGWSELKDHLVSGGDILFYGCNIAGTAEGEALIDQIAVTCDADVAASTDTTGVSGNWDLEYTSGDVETASLTVDDYSYDLDEYVVDTFDELREALEEVADNGGNHTIRIDGDIAITDTIDVNVENELYLTIKGANDDIELTGEHNKVIFNILDGDLDDCYIEITVNNLNFNGNDASSAINADGVAHFGRGGSGCRLPIL